MARVTRPTQRSGTLVAECDDSVAELAESMLGVVAGFEGRGRGLADGVRVQFGWSVLTIKKHDGELVVHEPDFAGDPESEVRPDVTCTLTVASVMADTVQAVGAEPMDLRYDDRMVVARGCLELPDVYLMRSPPRGEDCGWYVGPVENPPAADDPSAFESRSVWQLLHERPALLAVMALPPGYLIVFSGDEIVSLSPPEGAGETETTG